MYKRTTEVREIEVARSQKGSVHVGLVKRIYPDGRCYHNVLVHAVGKRPLGVRDLVHLAHSALELRFKAWLKAVR
jgi:hypothetical protein